MIIGKTATGLKKNNFARSEMSFKNFRLTVQVKLIGNLGNSGIQFASESHPGGLMKGYQADVGPGWWGNLYDEHGRGSLTKKPTSVKVRKGEWNQYEILVVGNHVRTAINGQLCSDFTDPTGAKTGVIGLQVHSGGPTEVRFKEFELELNPKDELSTTGRGQ